MLVVKTLLGNVGSTGPIHHQPCWYPFKPRYLGHITYETSSIINTHKSPSISTSIPISSIKNGSKTHLPTRPREPPGPPCLPGCHQCPCKATRKAESSPKELPLPAADILGDTQRIIHTWRFCGSSQTWHMVYDRPSDNANPHPAYDSVLMD